MHGWNGLDVSIRSFATPIAIIGGVLLAVWSLLQASQGEKLGGIGSLLVLSVVVSVAAKLAAESYLFSYLSGNPSPQQRAALRMIGPLVGLSRIRYAFGAIGGVILPLGVQILSSGAKNIPPANDAWPSAVCAVLAALCLLISEPAERKLFRLSLADSAGVSHE